ncbi:MAG: hypothetical protein ABEN55_21175 [Bradymonadaceae bacterium]
MTRHRIPVQVDIESVDGHTIYLDEVPDKPITVWVDWEPSVVGDDHDFRAHQEDGPEYQTVDSKHIDVGRPWVVTEAESIIVTQLITRGGT